ncbi:MAG: [protein-PII] uridylyltransferase [Proteobacteria bacterium]|nr:[protein-PII] uridylyltransferase [Pseudomonadota bacterium]
MPSSPALNLLDDTALQTVGSVSILRAQVRGMFDRLGNAFSTGVDITELVRARSDAVDRIMQLAWREHLQEADTTLALLAVGGYGRGELHPASDIDIMVLAATSPDKATTRRLEGFITFLWDIGLEIGHSVRTVAESVSAARDDITIATALMESRLLAGDSQLFETLQSAVAPPSTWPSPDFFSAKRKEQEERHAKFDNTAHKLEPNVKEAPGGLRDIQMIGWVAKRHFGVESLAELVRLGFLTRDEYEKLDEGRRFLWKVRFALHMLARRREERLLFDAQLKLSNQFGYRDAGSNRGVEQFMQHYYRTVTELSRLNEMLLELFEEEILLEKDEPPETINSRFQVRHGFIEITREDVFRQQPSALLELFLLLEQNPKIKGVSPSTIRELRRCRELINDDFRNDPRNRELFMRILREPNGVTHELRRMNRYGILGRYIPAFGAITGRMQFDLFHAYTVDEHILFVVSNLRRFALPRFDKEFPICSRIMRNLPKPEIAYLAGLFHDIGKGRGGDHSELGAVDAEDFCIEHGLSKYDARLVAWLVKHHLLLSVTAQKKDTTDPLVIQNFAQIVGDQLHLDYLYVLTVADVRGTNPALWNSWKARLFRDLYEQTRRALRRGLETPIDKEELIKETKDSALAKFAAAGHDTRRVFSLWSEFNEEYFLRHTADEISWHARILADAETESVLVRVRRETELGGTAVFIAATDDGSLFGRATAVLDQLGLNIVDARVVAVGLGRAMHTYSVLDTDGGTIEDEEREQQIVRALMRRLGESGDRPLTVRRRVPRQVRLFDTPVRIEFGNDANNQRTVIEITAGDRPGLLSEIGRAFNACGVRLQTAKVTTVGERAEDVFFVTDDDARPIETPEKLEQLEQTLRRLLDQNQSD